MADGTVFPAFLQLRHDPDNSAKASFLRQVDSTLGDAEARFKQFSAEANRQVEQAMSANRNSFGSLDIGADQLLASARAQQQRAIAAREVANATRIAAQENKDYSQSARQAVAATEALAREEEEAARAALSHASAARQVQEVLNRSASATDMVVQATGRGTTANQMMVNSQRAVRIAGLQAGQQLTDIAIQMEMGTRATTIFVQQIPQLAFALSGLEGSASKVQDRIGRFATFLSGPWGAAIFTATALLGPFIAQMFAGGDATDDLSKKSLTLTDALGQLRTSHDAALKALKDYNAEQERARDNADDMIKHNLAEAESNLKIALALRERIKAQIELENRTNRGTVPGMAGSVAAASSGAGAMNEAEIKALEQTLRNLRIEDATRDAKAAVDPIQAINDKYDDMASAARRAAAGNDDLSRSLEGTLTSLERQRKAALDAQRASTRAGSASSQASLGDMTALVRQLFPGATITSTTGGKHAASSDHYVGRAIDFVPAGGMGAYTTEQVEQILRDAGVDIRRNAGGTKQMFGPGRSASKPGDHDDHFHFAWQGGAPDPDKVAAAAARADQVLREFGERSAESIARVNERFDEQPRLIDTAARATRELDRIITDLSEKKPAGFEQMIADAEAAKSTIEDALVRPFEDMAESSARTVDIQRLLLQGREKEAAVVEAIWQMEELLGPLTSQQEDAVRGIVEAREDELEALKRLQEEQGAYLDATRSVRSELEAVFAGRGNLANFGNIFRELKAKTTVEALFGDALRDLDKWVQGSPLTDSVDYMAEQTDRAGNAALDFAATLNAATRALNPTHASFDQAFGPDFLSELRNEIVVTGQRGTAGGRKLEQGIAGMTPEAYFERMAKSIVGPIVDSLNEAFDTQFFSQLQGALGGALYGYSIGGSVGGVLGGARGLIDSTGILGGQGGSISDLLAQSLGGAKTGQLVNGIAGMFGLNLSNTGSSIGGAIGSFLPIPGGDIIGSIAGGLIGKLFGSTKYGTATLSGGGISTRGKGSGRAEGAGTLGGAVQEALANIADQLDAEIGSYLVSIGTYKDSFRVSGSGKTGKLKGGDVKSFTDQGEAIAYAVMDAIKDGAISGLSAGAQRLLQGNSDIEKAVQDALDFESVFKRIKASKDPGGAALDELDTEFARYKDLFQRAAASTAEWNELEELYWTERDKIVNEAMDRSLGTLRGFLEELTIGNSALSLRDRKSAAMAKYDPLATRVAAGDASAYDDFAEAARALLDIERQMSGSQTGYFQLLDRVTALTQGAIDGTAGTDFATRGGPFGERSANDNAAVVSGISGTNTLLEQNNSLLTAMNQNIGTLIAQGRAARGKYDYGEIEAGW